MQPPLERLLAEEDILYGIVASPDGQQWQEYGNKDRVPYDGIVLYYFPGPQGMAKLNAFLEGQILPKTIMQGDVMAIICKPQPDIIVGLFVVDGGDTVTKIRRGRSISAKVAQLFSDS